MSKTKGFQEGAQAMRNKILAECRKQNPGGMIQVHEVERWIATIPLPRPEQDQAPTPQADSVPRGT